jgi:hypothetical protein
MKSIYGGERGIRTPGALSSTTVFKTAGFNRSPSSPRVGSHLIVLRIASRLIEFDRFGQAASNARSAPLYGLKWLKSRRMAENDVTKGLRCPSDPTREFRRSPASP